MHTHQHTNRHSAHLHTPHTCEGWYCRIALLRVVLIFVLGSALKRYRRTYFIVDDWAKGELLSVYMRACVNACVRLCVT